MRIIASNIKADGQTSRAEFLYTLSNDVEALQVRITELETAARPFAHPDLCKRLPNNGSSSDNDAIIFVRNNAKITLADCRRIADVLNKPA
jgi:hypothetical protein